MEWMDETSLIQVWLTVHSSRFHGIVTGCMTCIGSADPIFINPITVQVYAKRQWEFDPIPVYTKTKDARLELKQLSTILQTHNFVLALHRLCQTDYH